MDMQITFGLVYLCVVTVFGEEIGRSSKEAMALMSFNSGIVSDPDGVLLNWGSPQIHVCNWTGIECNTGKTHVVQLVLSEYLLQGTISPALSNLSFLHILDLSDNFFSGHIPKELGSLSRLKELSLSSNMLQGQVPSELGHLNQLVYLNLGSNKLAGQIPESLFCNGTSSTLQYIDLSNNSLVGKIPLCEQCKLLELRYLLLWSNKLVGQIPPALTNSSQIEWLDLESNSLSGELPAEIVKKTPRLQFLYLSDNNFVAHDGNSNLSPFISALLNCSDLQELEVEGNKLGGKIPHIIGDLSTSLLHINLAGNKIYGPIPPSISSLFNLTLLNFSSNLLNGSIPSDMGRLKKLERVYFSNNSLSGEIPAAFGDIPHLGLLDLSKNKLSGSIPDTLCNLFQLRRLILHDNYLSGNVPPSLGLCVNLEILDISHNRISGEIPIEVAGLSSLKLYLNLSSNFLQGDIPLEFSKMDMVLAIDLSSNNLSGSVPPQLASCIALESLNLSGNSLQGHFPVQIGSLPYLQELDISSNQLSGELSQFLQASPTLEMLNISFNNFSGKVPHGGIFQSLTFDSLQGNPYICGSLSAIRSCKKKWNPGSIIIPVLFTIIGTPFVCFFAFKAKARKRSEITGGDAFGDEDQENTRMEYPRITYRQLVEATGGFDSSSLIGSGTFGNVYRGTLSDNTRIAVKVLESKTGSEISASFKRECQVLKQTRHRNLIRIITACSKPDFKALVLPLMSNGSLESHLYSSNGSGSRSRKKLTIVHLVSICSDIAEGVAYLHHHAPVKVVHCDLKPSNILLDDDMKALVADFGIAKLVNGVQGGTGDAAANLSACSMHSTEGLLCGSIGYIAPEYGMGRHASTEGDVYSFGVIILEFITGRRPTDILFHRSLNIGEWVKSLYPYKLEQIINDALRRFPPPDASMYFTNTLKDVILEMIELGLMCTHRNSSLRPSMLDVAQELSWLKQYMSTPSIMPIREVSSRDDIIS